MADISSYEGKQKSKRSQKDAGDITDRNEVKVGKSNFRGPQKSKSGLGVSPHASGSPWKYGRDSQSEGSSYSEDYSRKGSSYSQGATGPKNPSAEIPDNIYGNDKANSSRGKQKDHV